MESGFNERNLLSKEHFVDGGYLSVDGVGLGGPIRPRSTRQSRKGAVFHREDFAIDGDTKEVTCQGKVSRRWSTPPSFAPYVNAEFAQDDCRQYPVKAFCTVQHVLTAIAVNLVARAEFLAPP
ncbi:hypothetical protein OG885_09575 [Streptomyces sp. NBC_00028]|uniref:hypothetical protein n=1 Tax=Streptomyces sp. NBC_00028 TaxID=2975624 RepID=UPI003248C024